MDLTQLTGIIKSLASKAGVSGGEIIVGVVRSQVELRNLLLPKADSNEMPDMVRFTALRQFANVGDTWPIDFAPMPPNERSTESIASSDAVEMQEVVAMTINPMIVSQIRKVCTDAGFTVTQIGLRPMASGTLAAMVANSPVGPDSTVLLVDILADEADMVVLEKGHVSFMRTVRLLASDDEPRGPIPIGEIRRTLIAAVNARPGLKIDRVILWSDPQTAETSVQAWQPNLDIPVEAINPLSLIELKRSVEVTQDTGRFAPLIGMLLQRKLSQKAIPANTFIDFLHPRKRTEKKKPIRQYVLAATAATLLVGGAVWWYRSAHQALDAEIAELLDNYSKMEPSLKLATDNSKNWSKVERFLSGDIQWLDKISFFSQQSLPSDQMMVGDTQIGVNPVTNAGEVKMRIAITDPKLEPKLEELFRNQLHQVGTKGVNESKDPNSVYRWTFEPEIVVAPAVVIDPTTLPPPEPSSPEDTQQPTREEDAPRT
jgi:Tfp pilus assembly PilM family ATPase